MHRTDLGRGEVEQWVTSPERTLLDCLRALPLTEAVAVADSALRHGFGRARLLALARGARGPGSRQVRYVADLATPEAANPVESALRALASEVPGPRVRPQVPIHDPHFLGRPDLVDERLGIVLEADSFTWHASRAAFARDCRR